MGEFALIWTSDDPDQSGEVREVLSLLALNGDLGMSPGDFAFVMAVVAAMAIFATTLFSVAWFTNAK